MLPVALVGQGDAVAGVAGEGFGRAGGESEGELAAGGNLTNTVQNLTRTLSLT